MNAIPPCPALLMSSDKVHARHRDRDAVVYVRQSTVRQVLQHQEFDTLAIRAGRPRLSARLDE